MRGALGLFSLPDLLQLLASNGSRGALTVQHPERGEARLYLEAGRVVHASFDGREDLEALRALLADERGSFEFRPGLAPTAATIEGSLDNLLLAAIRGLEPTAETKTPAPDELDVASPVDLRRVGELRLEPDELAIVELVDGRRNLAELARLSGRPPAEVNGVLGRLAGLGLLELRRRSPRVARLVVGLSRELTGMVVYLDDAIMRTWTRQHGRPVTFVRVREASGRETVFGVGAAPDLGAYLLFSSGALLRHGLRAGDSVLVKPEVESPA